MKFKEQRQIAGQLQRKAAIVRGLFDAHHPMADYFREKVDRVLTRALEIFREGKTGKSSAQICPQMERTVFGFETDDQFCLFLRIAFGNDGTCKPRRKLGSE